MYVTLVFLRDAFGGDLGTEYIVTGKTILENSTVEQDKTNIK